MNKNYLIDGWNNLFKELLSELNPYDVEIAEAKREIGYFKCIYLF